MEPISAPVTVEGSARVSFDRGLEGGEKAILDYLTSDECPAEDRLNPNHEDAGYQVYLLSLVVVKGMTDPYIAQYRKYKAWLKEQRINPQFYWGSNGPMDMSDMQHVTSPYANYIRSDSVRLIEEVRARTPPNYDLVVQEDDETLEEADLGTEAQEEAPAPAEVPARDPQMLTRLAEAIARMRLSPGVRGQGCKFGSVRSLENSVLLSELRRCVNDRQAQRMLVQWFPCLPPTMNEDVHKGIIKEFLSGRRDTKLLLAALQRYESILRDMMEAEGTKKIADLYAIGLRSSKRMDGMPDESERVTDIFNTERMCLRFMQMKYALRAEKTLLDKCLKRLEFLENEHKALRKHGAEDDRDYNSVRQDLVDAIEAHAKDPANMGLFQSVIGCIDILSFELTLGIEECLWSIGTEHLRPERLIGRRMHT